MNDPFGDDLKSGEFRNENHSAQAHLAAAKKREARVEAEVANPGVTYQADGAWKDARAEWQAASDAYRSDLVFGMGFFQGAKLRDIARFFCIKEADLKQYKEIWEQASASLKLKVQGHQIRWAFTTNQAHAKFFMGLQFAGQVQNPVQEDQQSLDDQRDQPKVIVEVVGGKADVVGDLPEGTTGQMLQ